MPQSRTFRLARCMAIVCLAIACLCLIRSTLLAQGTGGRIIGRVAVAENTQANPAYEPSVPLDDRFERHLRGAVATAVDEAANQLCIIHRSGGSHLE